jgi:hypothetical protein
MAIIDGHAEDWPDETVAVIEAVRQLGAGGVVRAGSIYSGGSTRNWFHGLCLMNTGSFGDDEGGAKERGHEGHRDRKGDYRPIHISASG